MSKRAHNFSTRLLTNLGETLRRFAIALFGKPAAISFRMSWSRLVTPRLLARVTQHREGVKACFVPTGETATACALLRAKAYRANRRTHRDSRIHSHPPAILLG